MTKQLKVLVTGASSGIGRATAIELAGRGHRVLVAARRLAALEELATASPRIAAVPIDVTDGASVVDAVRRVNELTSGEGLDVLVNSAGYALLGPVETLSGEAVQHQFATNVFGLLNVTRAFLPPMRQRGRGRIINLSSVVGRVAFPGMGIYSATKFALEAVSDALRMELARFGISVVLIEPTFVVTDLGPASERQAARFPLEADGYEQMIANTRAYLARQLTEHAMPAEAVARRIAEAATTGRPKARYVVPASQKVVIGLMGALPVAIADRAKLSTLGLSKAASLRSANVRPHDPTRTHDTTDQ